MLAWACAVGILGLSVPIICSSEFFYTQNIYRRSDELCNLCFDKDCLTLEKARCDYYAEAASIVPKDKEIPGGIEDAAKRKEVDGLMFELVKKGLYYNMECIPYISRYTNCNKDNVCLGCKTCACDPEGKWKCTTLQPCQRQDPPLNIDHRVLVIIMDAISDHTHPRIVKRSVTDNPRDSAITVTLEQLSEWLYGDKPFSLKGVSPRVTTTTEFAAVEDDERANEIAAIVTDPSSSLSVLRTTEQPKTATTEDNDSIAFEEVLRDIAVEPKTDNPRKLIGNKPFEKKANNEADFTVDYMIMDEDNVAAGRSNNEMSNMVNFVLDYDDGVSVSKPIVTNATEVVIDLLDTPVGSGTYTNVTEDFTNYTKEEDPNIFENMNDIIEHSAFNIMKRDVAGQGHTTAPNVKPTVTITVNTTNITTSTNTTEDSTDLKENVLIPLNRIISEKIKELENLQKIKDDLLKFVKIDAYPDDKPKENNITSNTYFSIYNVAVRTGLDVDLKRANPNKYEKYMFKLKTDIFEVIRDIYGIRKYKNSDIPNDLKLLVNAMKRYVYTNKLFEKPKRNKLKRFRSFRRNNEQTGPCDRLSLKECLVRVIEVIDQDAPKLNALSPLSPATRDIMKHIVKFYYLNQFTMPALRVFDPHYNLTVFLNSIGSRWQDATANLIGSPPFASLYKMKLLHCILTLDINKMNDALDLINFTYSRRMTMSLDKVSDETFDKIDAGLTLIHNKILSLIKYYAQPAKSQVNEQPRAIMELITESTAKPQGYVPMVIKDLPEMRKKKKHSFIKHIRSLLKTSKHDIKELLHKKVPKSEIVRQLAKKRLDQLSEKRYGEYEETMKRWQKNLEITKKMKRSITDQFKTRIKNIIPKYLRHKVNPKIKENQKNATAERNADARKRKGKKVSRHVHNVRKTTTPRPRKLSKPGVRTKIITTLRPTIRAPTGKTTSITTITTH